jgi:O-antigen/teichoic acid export membrane protein
MKYFKNTSWLMGEKILRIGVGLFVGIWVARYLGPEQFGLLSYAQSFVFLFTAIATLGLDGIVVRELVKYPKKRGSLLGTAFGLKFIGAILILPILAVAVQLTSNDNYTNLLVFIIASATIFQSFNVIDFYCQATVQSKYVAFANAATLAISSVVKVALLLNEAPLIAFAAMIVFDSIVLSSGLIYFYFKYLKLKLIDLKFSQTIAIELLRDSWPLILSGLVVSVYMKIDQVMIKEIIDLEAVGQYAAAVRISEAWYFIPMVIASSIFPAIINAKNISNHAYYIRIQNLYSSIVWVTVVITVPISLFSDWVISFLYGLQYSQAANVLTIHALSGVFVSLGVVSGKWYLIENLQMLAFWRTFFGMLINVLLNFILIPTFGLIGAAFATLVGQAAAAIIFDVFHKKTRPQFRLKVKALLLINNFEK